MSGWVSVTWPPRRSGSRGDASPTPASASGKGAWAFVNDEANETRTLDPAASNAARVDLVIGRVHDSAYHAASGVSSQDNKAEIRVIKGTNGSSVPAAVPANLGTWFEIGRVSVPAGLTTLATSHITQPYMQQAVAAGGVLPVQNVAAIEALKGAVADP